ncbi:MAG TPA: hypothetical protein PLH82_03475 [Candidatus Paceibacterota bacterium]|jgi:hypothetical protein|nr:hypothetical protein [Candidatus Paceibacterota bacterium]
MAHTIINIIVCSQWGTVILVGLNFVLIGVDCELIKAKIIKRSKYPSITSKRNIF